MIDTLAIFKNRVPDFNRLLANGFAKSDGGYQNSYELLNGEFEMEIFVSDAGKVSVKVFDAFLREEYVLVHMPGAGGGFVGTVTAACEKVLVKIAERCFYFEVFKTKQAKQIMEYAEKTYGGELEFLWNKLPDNAILRRKDTQKWYAAFLKVPNRWRCSRPSSARRGRSSTRCWTCWSIRRRSSWRISRRMASC